MDEEELGAPPARQRDRSLSKTLASAASGVSSLARETWWDVGDRLEHTARRVNGWAEYNVIGRWFNFKGRQATFTVECRAGLSTFLMVAYVLAVIPNVLITTGGTCDPKEVCSNYSTLGPACLADASDAGAQSCLDNLKANLITATAASSLIATFMAGFMANMPVALAPGIGISAYVAYQVVGQFGTGSLTYSQAMTAIFVEGWIFILLSVTGVRGGAVKYIPKSIAMASSVGIGLLLAFTGLHNLGVIAFDRSTFIGIGGCDEASQTWIYSFNHPMTNVSETIGNFSAADGSAFLPIPAAVHGCSGDKMRSATMWLGIAGGVLMAVLLFAGVKGSLVIGILFVTIISWIPNQSASYLGASSPIMGGQQRLETFKKVVALPSLDLTGLAWDWSAFGNGHLWLALFTFLYIDLLDCTGTLLSMARLLDFHLPGFMNESCEFPGQMWAYLSDGSGIVAGSMMGTTSLTVYIESAAGIEDGGRTGLTAIVVSFFFFVALFFSPILASIPPFATGPALVLAGSIMLGYTAQIAWDDAGEAIPAFLTIIVMPFTYSVAYGVIAGMASYILIRLPFWAWDFIVLRLRKQGPDDPSKRAAVYRGRLHRRMFAGDLEGGSSQHGSQYQEQTIHANDYSLGPYGDYSHNGGSTFNTNVSHNTTMNRRLPAHFLTGPRTSLQPSELNASTGRSYHGQGMFRRSLTSPSPGVRGLANSHSIDSAYGGSRTGPSGSPGDPPVGGSSHPSQPSPHPSPNLGGSTQSIDPSQSWHARRPLPQRASSAPLRRPNSYSGQGGGLVGLYPASELEQRESASLHGGNLYENYLASQQAQQPQRGPQRGQQGQQDPDPSLGGSSRGTGGGGASMGRQGSSGAPELLRRMPTLTFSGGTFRLVGTSGSLDAEQPSPGAGLRRGASIGPGGSEAGSDLPYGAPPSPGGNGVVLLRRSATWQQGELPPLGPGGRAQLRGAPSMGGSSSLMRLFDMQPGDDSQMSGGGGGGSAFQLFGDVQLPPEAFEEGEEGSEEGVRRAKSFRLFGDVELPPDAFEDSEGDGEGGEEGVRRAKSFRLFGDVELPPEAFESEAGGSEAGAAGSEAAAAGGAAEVERDQSLSFKLMGQLPPAPAENGSDETGAEPPEQR